MPLVWHFDDRTADRTTTVVVPLLAPDLGRRDHRRASSRCFHYRRGARPGGTDETSFTLFPFVHYRRDANTRVLATPLGASARGPNRSGGFFGPYIWYDDKELSLRFIPFLHTDVTRHDTGERTAQYGLWFTIDGPGRKARVLFPLFGTYDDEQEKDTWVVPTLLPDAPQQRRPRRRGAARFTGNRTSAIATPPWSARTTIAPRPACTTSASRRCSSTRATRIGASTSSRRCSPTAATSTTARTSGSGPRCSTSTSTTANRA